MDMEKGEWKNKDICEMIIDEVKELKNPEGKVVGTSTQNVTINATMEDLQGGLDMKQTQIEENKKIIEKSKQTIENLGKVPAKTAELVRLERNIQNLNALNVIRENETKILNAENSIAKDEEFVKNRIDIINKRPE